MIDSTILSVSRSSCIRQRFQVPHVLQSHGWLIATLSWHMVPFAIQIQVLFHILTICGVDGSILFLVQVCHNNQSHVQVVNFSNYNLNW